MHRGKITSTLTRRHRTHSNASSGVSADGSSGEGGDDNSIMEPDQGNVLTHIISQLRPGADLSRVVLPTFILEPRSMLERITNFMCHPEMLLSIPEMDDPVDRFVSVVKFYLSGWHIRPPGVKKPLNPILGEVFTCYWDLPDNTRAYYISEQTSHHPPKSSYFYMAPDHHIRIDGTLKPRSKFLGNSAASLMEGVAVLSLLNRGKDRHKGERYWLTQPNMYARGILFGNMKYELGDHSVVHCPELGLIADIDFKTKGWVSGTYNAIGGTIKDEKTNQVLFELSGLWSEEMCIKDLRNGKKQTFFDARKAKPSSPKVRPVAELHENESQKLWQKTAQAVKEKNHELATDEKTKVEDMQREEAAKRMAAGVEWHPRLFRPIKPEIDGTEEEMEKLEWIINAHIDADTPQKQAQQITAIFPVLPGQLSKHDIPPRHVSHEHPTTTGKPPSGNHGGDLVDFEQNPGVVAPRAERPTTMSQVHSPTTGKSPSENKGGDLVDFGQNDDAVAPQAERPTTMEKQPSSDIPNLLEATGRKVDGPLLDFTADLKRDLPSQKAAGPAQIKRSDTEESNDAFFDAEG